MEDETSVFLFYIVSEVFKAFEGDKFFWWAHVKSLGLWVDKFSAFALLQAKFAKVAQGNFFSFAADFQNGLL